MLSALDQFLANVMALESEAAGHYERFARVALEAGDAELEGFFAGLAELTRMEAAEARTPGAAGALPAVALVRRGPPPDDVRNAIRAGSKAALKLHRVMTEAIELKRRCHEYYASIAALSSDACVQPVAEAWERESATHLQALERWVVRLGG